MALRCYEATWLMLVYRMLSMGQMVRCSLIFIRFGIATSRRWGVLVLI
jgi:hypothetical protein